MATNTHLGTGALGSVTTGTDLTAVGYNAGKFITLGTNHTVVGGGAAENLLEGDGNSIYGCFAARNLGNLPGSGVGIRNSSNSIFGYHACENLSGGVSNSGNCVFGTRSGLTTKTMNQCVIMGMYSFPNDTLDDLYAQVAIGGGAGGTLQGPYNTCVGFYSAHSGAGLSSTNNSGEENVAIGAYTMQNPYATVSIDTSKNYSRSVAIGTYAMGNGTKKLYGENNIAIGYRAGYNTGSTGGTKQDNLVYIANEGYDNESGVIRIGNNQQHSKTYLIPQIIIDNENINDSKFTRFSSGNNGVAGGSTQSGDITIQTSTGLYKGQMSINFNGYANSFVHYQYNPNKLMWSMEVDQVDSADDIFRIASYNSSVRNNYLQFTGNGKSSSFGARSGGDLISGPNNTSLGTDSLASLSGGGNNTATGVEAGMSIVGGGGNCCYGNGSLKSLVYGLYNTGMGYNSLTNASGYNNTAVGSGAGSSLTTGNNNIFVGSGVLSGGTASNFNDIYIGNAGVANESNTIRIGSTSGWLGDHDRTFISGIRGVTTAINDAITVYISSEGQLGTISSSRKTKENIKTINHEIDNFDKLNPVSFNYISDEKKTINYGLIAEEVKDIYPELVVGMGDNIETVKYHLLYGLMIKKIQNQSEEIKELKKQNEEMVSMLGAITSRLDVLENKK